MQVSEDNNNYNIFFQQISMRPSIFTYNYDKMFIKYYKLIYRDYDLLIIIFIE